MMFWSRVPVVPVAPVVVTVGGSQAPAVAIDPVAVAAALKERVEASVALVAAREGYLAAFAAERNAFNAAYLKEGGPEHLRKVAAEDAASELRAARDEAEVVKLAAEERVSIAKDRFRAAMGGVPADGGER